MMESGMILRENLPSVRAKIAHVEPSFSIPYVNKYNEEASRRRRRMQREQLPDRKLYRQETVMFCSTSFHCACHVSLPNTTSMFKHGQPIEMPR